MVAEVAKKAPNFKGTAVMPNGDFSEISLERYAGKYVLLYFFPLAFTYVCPSEIVAFDKAAQEFSQRNVQVISCSVDSHFVHAAWRNTPLNKGGIGQVSFPMLSDLNHEISKAYGCHLNPPGVALRGLYIIDRDQIIRHITVNDLPLGRSVEEALRVIDAMQFHEEHGEVCPANWKKGMPGMKASAAGVAEYMGSMEQ